MQAHRARQSVAVAFVVAVVAAPFALINKDFSMLGMGTDETLHTLLRFCALMGISLLFLQVVTGAFRPLLRGVFKPAAIQRFHTASGVGGFAFIVCHFALLIPSIGEHWANLNHGFFVLGPVVLAILLTTLGAALLLRRARPLLFARLHTFNYLVFAVGSVHAMGIGTQGSAASGRALLGVYVAICLCGLGYRATKPAWRRRLVPARVKAVR